MTRLQLLRGDEHVCGDYTIGLFTYWSNDHYRMRLIGTPFVKDEPLYPKKSLESGGRSLTRLPINTDFRVQTGTPLYRQGCGRGKPDGRRT